MVEVTGAVTSVPATFWSTHDALATLENDVQVTAAIAGRSVCGHIFIPIAELERGWSTLQVSPEPVQPNHQPTDLLPSPWMALIDKVARHFRYSDGRSLSNKRFTTKTIVEFIELQWQKEIFGDFSQSAATAIARFVRHPDNETLGKPTREQARADRKRRLEETEKAD